MSYLDRYLQGHYEFVWDELSALGPAILAEPLYSEAMAVVRETMRRVRHNCELLIHRLVEAGFVFGYDRLVRDILLRQLSGADWETYIEVLQSIRQEPPIFLPAQLDEERRAQVLELGLDDIADDILSSERTPPDMYAHINDLDDLVGPLPLSLLGWYDQVGAVNLYGYHPRWARFVDVKSIVREADVNNTQIIADKQDRYFMSHCDPLQVCALDDKRMQDLREEHERRRLTQFEFAPDRDFKNYTAGSGNPYAISLVNAGIDGTLVGYPSTTFVQYLRTCFKWAGFPGMAEWPTVPANDLAYLTEGLLPF